ncbi:efflux RND transporter periplasmic adaptor subunit [Flavihumibacter sp. R14]|nr:efflux RND transporter periplasmic adaptor subunit [Flavihumibacter soli]
MKRSLQLLAVILLCMTVLVSCSNEKKSLEMCSTKYTCPMHPQIIQDAAGTCPICQMDLVPLNQAGNATELMLNASQIQLANVQTMKVGTGTFGTSKVLNARLLSNPEKSEAITAKFPGRIEKLYANETGRLLSAGTPLYRIYSEELLTLQQDYMLQVKQVEAFPQESLYQNMREAARKKLILYGYSDAQVKALEKSKNNSATITVYAQRGGIIREINVTEGSYVGAGTTILALENLGSLWVEADVYPAEVSSLKMGMPVKVQVNGMQGSDQTVNINYIAPQLNPGTQMLSIRASIHNADGKLQPGMQASVYLPVSSASNTVRLPLSAVIRSARGAHVWIRTGNETFSPRTVSTGAEDADNIVITSGLKGGEEVVITGAYLLYSEFVLKKGVDPLLSLDHK